MMRDFSFDEIKNALNLPDEFEIPRQMWNPIHSFYTSVPEYFLAREKLIEILDYFNLDTELTNAILMKLEDVVKNDYWKSLAYHLYDALFLEDVSDLTHLQNVIRKLPRLTGLLGENSSLFYVFPYIYEIPAVLNMYRERGLPADVALATLRDLFLWMYEYRKQYGEWGLMALEWFILHFNLRLFQLGRLQFETSHFGYDFHVFKNRKTKDVLVLAGDGMKFRSDGQFFDADGSVAKEYWEARYEKRSGKYVGHIIDRRGFSKRDIVELKEDVWLEILRKGDSTLGVHIPAGGPPPGHGSMSSERCDESFALARDFFKKYFPKEKFKAFTCVSWLLDPQFRLYLKNDSNIVSFQSRFYLHPVPGANDEQTYERVFSYNKAKWHTLPAVTSLQKIVREHETRGGKWREHGGIIPI